MESFGDVIDAFGGTGAFAEAVGVADSHARTMKARDSIPPEYWAATAATAEARKIEGVTLAALAALAARRRKPADQHAGAAA